MVEVSVWQRSVYGKGQYMVKVSIWRRSVYGRG